MARGMFPATPPRYKNPYSGHTYEEAVVELVSEIQQAAVEGNHQLINFIGRLGAMEGIRREEGEQTTKTVTWDYPKKVARALDGLPATMRRQIL